MFIPMIYPMFLKANYVFKSGPENLKIENVKFERKTEIRNFKS